MLFPLTLARKEGITIMKEFSRQTQEDTRAYGNNEFVRWADIQDASGLYWLKNLAFLF